jgi:hypothetical protein
MKIFYDRDKKSFRWGQRAYYAFVRGIISDKTQLNAAVLKMLPIFTEDGILKENFLRIKSFYISNPTMAREISQMGASNYSGFPNPEALKAKKK